MSSLTNLSNRDLRQRREQAIDRLTYASWTAMGTAGIVTTLLLTAAFSDLEQAPALLLLLPTVVGQGVVGYKLREGSRWAAWAVLACFAMTVLLRWIEVGHPTSILTTLFCGVMYVRGFLAACDRHEVDLELARRDRAERRGGTPATLAGAT